MHELSLAHAVLDIVTQEAARHGLGSVTRIALEVGRLRAVVPELLRTGIEVAARGTRAEGAALDLTEVAARARCPVCGAEFDVPDYLFLCPGCERAGGEIIAGEELRVTEIEGD